MYNKDVLIMDNKEFKYLLIINTKRIDRRRFWVFVDVEYNEKSLWSENVTKFSQGKLRLSSFSLLV